MKRCSNFAFLSALLGWLIPVSALAQTAFVDFNTAGEYTGQFSSWSDVGGVNAGNYAFQENATNGVGGGGGVSVYQSTDTTATYNAGGWNLPPMGPR